MLNPNIDWRVLAMAAYGLAVIFAQQNCWTEQRLEAASRIHDLHLEKTRLLAEKADILHVNYRACHSDLKECHQREMDLTRKAIEATKANIEHLTSDLNRSEEVSAGMRDCVGTSQKMLKQLEDAKASYIASRNTCDEFGGTWNQSDALFTGRCVRKE